MEEIVANEAFTGEQNSRYGKHLTDDTSVHLTVWFKADTANSLYRFYLMEEVRK